MDEELKNLPRKSRELDKFMTTIMILVQVGITLVIAMIIALVILFFKSTISMTSIAVIGSVSFGSAAIIWSQILFRTKIFDAFFINVKQNWAAVLGNQMMYDQIPPSAKARIGMFKRRALREVGQGIRGKLPWETVVEMVNLKGELVMGTDDGKPLTCYTSDNVKIEIKWQVIITPLVGFAINLIRRDEGALRSFFKGFFEAEVITWVKQYPIDYVLTNKDEIKKYFEKVLGGDEDIHEKEMEWGVFTGNPQIIGVERDKRFQEAAEAKVIGARYAEVIDQINEKFHEEGVKPDPNMVMAAAAAITGTQVDGLLLIPGAGGSIQEMMQSAAALKDKIGKKPSKK